MNKPEHVIFIVDDNPTNLNVSRDHLTQSGRFHSAKERACSQLVSKY